MIRHVGCAVIKSVNNAKSFFIVKCQCVHCCPQVSISEKITRWDYHGMGEIIMVWVKDAIYWDHTRIAHAWARFVWRIPSPHAHVLLEVLPLLKGGTRGLLCLAAICGTSKGCSLECLYTIGSNFGSVKTSAEWAEAPYFFENCTLACKRNRS